MHHALTKHEASRSNTPYNYQNKCQMSNPKNCPVRSYNSIPRAPNHAYPRYQTTIRPQNRTSIKTPPPPPQSNKSQTHSSYAYPKNSHQPHPHPSSTQNYPTYISLSLCRIASPPSLRRPNTSHPPRQPRIPLQQLRTRRARNLRRKPARLHLWLRDPQREDSKRGQDGECSREEKYGGEQGFEDLRGGEGSEWVVG